MKYRVRIRTFNEIGHPENLFGTIDSTFVLQYSKMQNKIYTATSRGDGSFFYIEDLITLEKGCMEILEELPSMYEEGTHWETEIWEPMVPEFEQLVARQRIPPPIRIVDPWNTTRLTEDPLPIPSAVDVSDSTFSLEQIERMRNDILESISLHLPRELLESLDGES